MENEQQNNCSMNTKAGSAPDETDSLSVSLPAISLSAEERGILQSQVRDNLLALAPRATKRLSDVLRNRDTKTPQLLEAIRLTLSLAGFGAPKPQAAETGRKSLEDMSAEDLRSLANAAAAQLSERAVSVIDGTQQVAQPVDINELV